MAERLLRRTASARAARRFRPAAAPAPERAEDFPWHDPTLALDERMKLAEGRAPPRRLMAAMGAARLRPVRLSLQDLCGSDRGGRGEGPVALRARRQADGEAPQGAGRRGAAAGRAGAPTNSIGPVSPRQRRASTATTRPPPGSCAASRSIVPAPRSRRRTSSCRSPATGLDYAPGDSLGIWPVNHGEEVELLLAILRAKGSEAVTLPSARRCPCGKRCSGDATCASRARSCCSTCRARRRRHRGHAPRPPLADDETAPRRRRARRARPAGEIPSARPPIGEFVRRSRRCSLVFTQSPLR